MNQPDLQRFAEAPAPAAAPEAAASAPEATANTSLPSEAFGAREPAAPQAEQTAAPTFEELIRGRYREEYNARVQALLGHATAKARAGEQARRSEACAKLLREARAAAEAYPAMDLKAELADPAFRSLLRAGVEVKDAYALRHREALLAGAMQSAARAVAEKLAQSLPDPGARPLENGAASAGAAAVYPSVARLSRAQRRDLIARAREGERIEL